jgi:hypothetical protein
VPEFQDVSITDNLLNLTWSTEAGGTYQLQYTSDLSSSNWINLSGRNRSNAQRDKPHNERPATLLPAGALAVRKLRE